LSAIGIRDVIEIISESKKAIFAAPHISLLPSARIHRPEKLTRRAFGPGPALFGLPVQACGQRAARRRLRRGGIAAAPGGLAKLNFFFNAVCWLAAIVVVALACYSVSLGIGLLIVKLIPALGKFLQHGAAICGTILTVVVTLMAALLFGKKA
jgi:hypothetical protein